LFGILITNKIPQNRQYSKVWGIYVFLESNVFLELQRRSYQIWIGNSVIFLKKSLIKM